jgi:hypothetical protein
MRHLKDGWRITRVQRVRSIERALKDEERKRHKIMASSLVIESPKGRNFSDSFSGKQFLKHGTRRGRIWITQAPLAMLWNWQ